MNGLFGFILIIFGVISAVSPQSVWYISVGWKFKDAEPSDAALAMHRITGVIGVIVGIILIVSSCSSGFVSTKWEKQFQERIEAGEVTNISFDYNRISITAEERDMLVRMMKEAALTRFDLGTSYGYSGSGVMTFQDGEEVKLILFGPSGGIELHPSDVNHAYRIESTELESWIRTNIINWD
ncbi:DUF6199 family natural product biosynthesis protein [Paenibacillus sp. NPDC057967]|uniref:DUF6199 family natural product biosynthesis protein n=1 Tax=Paenibacillus sp. NPDC057967 TaxID=3346293 RepID=UPI0036DEE104